MPLDDPQLVSATIKNLLDNRNAGMASTVAKDAEDVEDALNPWLEAMSHPESRAFECETYRIINAKIDGERREWPAVRAALEDIIKKNRGRTDDLGKKVAYGALYILCTKARRENRLNECVKFLLAYADVGQQRATYDHLWGMVLSSRRDGTDLSDAFNRARSARDKLKEQGRHHIGVDHSYAEIVAFLAEEGGIRASDEPGNRDIRLALRLAEAAVEGQEDYAKFHATVGRLKAALGMLDEAERDVLKALRLEFDNWDSPVRRIEYKGILTRIQLERQKATIGREIGLLTQAQLKEQRKQVEEEVQSVRKHADEAKVQHIEILGLFAGVLALVLAGMAGLFSQKPDSPARTVAYAAGTSVLLMMLGGTILIVFGGLGATVHEKRRGPIIAVCLGAALFAVAWFVAWIVSGSTSDRLLGWLASFPQWLNSSLASRMDGQ